MAASRGFVAYPSDPPAIGQAIEAAVSALGERLGIDGFQIWPETNIVGQFLARQVLDHIDQHECLVADITQLNFNVTFEIGYALGRGKPLLLVRHSAIEQVSPTISEVGVFDTLGYESYQNSNELVELLRDSGALTPTKISAVRLNNTAPVYLIDALYKTDAVTRIIARVKKAKLTYRSFDPNEQPRLSGFEAIQHVAQSFAVLLHLLPSRVKDAPIHNMRVAFLAGLATGMGKVLLVLQDGDEPVPLDYRDLVTPFYHPGHIDEAIGDFAARVTESLQAGDDRMARVPRTFLETLTLGASAAENELKDLAHYYLETDAFRRAYRGELRIVVGRKGSGKTALFLQLGDQVRRSSQNVLLDLKPEGYKLLKFKEVVLDLLQEGTVEHTLTAFWEYVLLLEICRKLLEDDKVRHMRDGRLFAPYKTLAAAYAADEYVAEGDFAERLTALLQRIRDDFDARYSNLQGARLSHAEITTLLYRHDVAALRSEVAGYLRFKKGLWFLIDNLDKGWPAHGLRAEDLTILRTLLEATRKIEREFTRDGLDAHTLVLLRNDVFELLVGETPDRGKEPRAGVDWTDPDLLRELVRRRIVFNGLSGTESFADVWPRVCVSHYHGEETSQYLIERSLMRPRALLDLINHCRSCAVNLGHTRIEPQDIEKGLALYSSDLLREIGLEIRDILPEAEDVLYAFIDVPSRLKQDALSNVLRQSRLTGDRLEQLTEILLWYGVLGIVRDDGEVEYIYSVNYDMRLLRGRAKRLGDNLVFGINPAFWPALGIRAH